MPKENSHVNADRMPQVSETSHRDGDTTPVPQDAADQIAQDEGGFSASLFRQHPVIWTITLFGPPIGTLVLLGLFAVTEGWGLVVRLVATAALTVFAAGRFIILTGVNGEAADAVHFTSEQLALLVFYLDVAFAIVLSFHMSVLFKLPFAGERLRLLVREGQTMVKHQKWMRRMTVGAIVLFVMVPIASTGSVGGAIFGRLLGLTRPGTLASAIAGSLLGCLLMYQGAELVQQYIDPDDTTTKVAGVAVVIGLIALLNSRYRRLVRDR